MAVGIHTQTLLPTPGVPAHNWLHAAHSVHDGDSQRRFTGGQQKLPPLQKVISCICSAKHRKHHLGGEQRERPVRAVRFKFACLNPAACELNGVHIPWLVRTSRSEAQNAISLVGVEQSSIANRHVALLPHHSKKYAMLFHERNRRVGEIVNV